MGLGRDPDPKCCALKGNLDADTRGRTQPVTTQQILEGRSCKPGHRGSATPTGSWRTRRQVPPEPQRRHGPAETLVSTSSIWK